LLRNNKFTLKLGKKTEMSGDNKGGIIGFILDPTSPFLEWNQNLLAKIDNDQIQILSQAPDTPQKAIGFKGWFNIPYDALLHPMLVNDYDFNHSIFIDNYITINPKTKQFYITRLIKPKCIFEMPYTISQPQKIGTLKWILRTNRENNTKIINISQEIQNFYPLNIIYPFIQKHYFPQSQQQQQPAQQPKPVIKQEPALVVEQKPVIKQEPKKIEINIQKNRITENNRIPESKEQEIHRNLIVHQKPYKINEWVSQTYVINLKKRPDRLKNMTRRLGLLDIPFKRIEAYNGMENPSQIIYNKRHMLPGEMGYVVSMQKIFVDAYINNHEWILVMDDDCMFCNNFGEQVNQILGELENNKKDLLAVYLGASQYHWRFKTGKDGYQCNDTTGSFCVLYNRKLFTPLLRSSRNYSKVFDTGILMPLLNKYRKRTFVCFPNLVIADVRDSDIRQPKNFYTEARLLKWNLRNFMLDQ
jgi:GR25 family glycosyltransferase involved in LPS biosynthesis